MDDMVMEGWEHDGHAWPRYRRNMFGIDLTVGLGGHAQSLYWFWDATAARELQDWGKLTTLGYETWVPDVDGSHEKPMSRAWRCAMKSAMRAAVNIRRVYAHREKARYKP